MAGRQRRVFGVAPTAQLRPDLGFLVGAGEGNRTLMTSLEGWGSAIELRPRARRPVPSSTDSVPVRRAPRRTTAVGESAGAAAVSGGGEVPRRTALGDVGPRGGRLRSGSAGCGAAWLARLLWEQEAAGSNPAIPTSSEHMSILVRFRLGAKLGAMCYRLVRGRHQEARVRRGLDLLRACI
jgi:hypothetical protein